MRANPDKVHVPTAAEAARWYALAEVAMQVATGASKAWHELERLAKACDGESVRVFGVLASANPCILLLRHAMLAAGSTTPHIYDAPLKIAGEAVKAAYYDWEAGAHG